MEVLLSGASGLIGSALTVALTDAGHRPVRLVRRKPEPGEDAIRWDPLEGVLDAVAFDGVDAVVNLSGAGIGDRRWSESYKKELVSSRTRSTTLLATTLAELSSPPRRLLSGSAIGFYGDTGGEIATESSAGAETFLATLVKKWESAAQPAVDAGISTAFLRTGIVLSPKGGALKKMLPLFKLGLGGKLGRGHQVMSWISLTDQVQAILFLLDNDVTGPVNLTAPHPVSNLDFTNALGAVLGRPTFLGVPRFGPKLLLGSELADALLFESAHIEPKALTDAGYSFSHPELAEALRAELMTT